MVTRPRPPPALPAWLETEQTADIQDMEDKIRGKRAVDVCDPWIYFVACAFAACNFRAKFENVQVQTVEWTPDFTWRYRVLIH